MSTLPIKKLVERVLNDLERPYTEDVIEEVFCALEVNPGLRKEYDALCDRFGTDVVNQWGGKWIAIAVERSGGTSVPSTKCSIITSYSKLSTPRIRSSRKVKEAEAREAVYEYFKAHESELPPSIRNHKEDIVDLFMKGASIEEAFSDAVR